MSSQPIRIGGRPIAAPAFSHLGSSSRGGSSPSLPSMLNNIMQSGSPAQADDQRISMMNPITAGFTNIASAAMNGFGFGRSTTLDDELMSSDGFAATAPATTPHSSSTSTIDHPHRDESEENPSATQSSTKDDPFALASFYGLSPSSTNVSSTIQQLPPQKSIPTHAPPPPPVAPSIINNVASDSTSAPPTLLSSDPIATSNTNPLTPPISTSASSLDLLPIIAASSSQFMQQQQPSDLSQPQLSPKTSKLLRRIRRREEELEELSLENALLKEANRRFKQRVTTLQRANSKLRIVNLIESLIDKVQSHLAISRSIANNG